MNKKTKNKKENLKENSNETLKKDDSDDKNKNKNTQPNNDEPNELEQELEKLRDERLRLLAEMENLRKRSEKEKIDSLRFGSMGFARDILSPCDNLSRAIASLSEKDDNHNKSQNLINGIRMVHQELMTVLEKNGIKKIEALDKKFDHNIHQAMMEIESDEVEPGTVVQELQTGYMMHERLLRPSMVGVSKKKRNKSEAE
ncbi:MAG: Protein GrpE [Alphaproteobacteria bacterium MarineAlpha5_Bin11]|nr:nucleotide exchange factor GrpE [Pelagibacteraceae bacterium]PPR44850.1 MAG: Protein GrpE [Alphaproteobacteria bacterium MarineAlpha5_Bin11]PPR51818.1 MAG: Protein GrpE [Alphaproteobacteria bacterium MarineAlpha5_Bin10]|tara:strand:+ start:14171 stop:14770 length:600 start_codon:yes stop_codon:yes gene_type:complete